MLVSQIDLSKGINGGSWGFPKESRVEIPNCDSLFIIHDENSRANYIEHYGDMLEYEVEEGILRIFKI